MVEIKLFKCICWEFLGWWRIVEVRLSHKITLYTAFRRFHFIFINNLRCLMTCFFHWKLSRWAYFLIDVFWYFYLILFLFFICFQCSLYVFNLFNFDIVLILFLNLFLIFWDLELILFFYFNLLDQIFEKRTLILI